MIWRTPSKGGMSYRTFISISILCTSYGHTWIPVGRIRMGNKTTGRRKKAGKARAEARTKKSSGGQRRLALPTKAELEKRAKKLRALLDEWMKDESGYDEQTWPELKAA